jgi:hypothetical protein
MCDLIIGETAMRLTLALTIAVGLAVPAHAQFARPETCERIATTQFDNCTVSNIFRCEAEAFTFWIETLDADGALTVETRNADHGSMAYYFASEDASIQLTTTKAHPRDTIRLGAAEDLIAGELAIFGMTRPVSGQTRYGYAGETTELAGETLARIAFEGSIVLPPPMPDLSGGGSFLYSDRLDLLIEEEVRYEAALEGESYRLAHLALADQAGFGDETPGYGCGEMSFLVPRDVESAS